MGPRSGVFIHRADIGNRRESMPDDWKNTATLVLRIRYVTFGTPWVIGFGLAILVAVGYGCYVLGTYLGH